MQNEKAKNEAEEVEEKELQRLLEERRVLRRRGCKGKEISDLSKQIQRKIKRRQKKKQDTKIVTILDSFCGLKEIAGIRGGGKRMQMTAMKNKYGEEVQGKQQMADVFADFYEDLYASKRDIQESQDNSIVQEEGPVETVTAEEVLSQLKVMAANKAADASGIVVEMLQHGGRPLADVLAAIFTGIFTGEAAPPKRWKKAIIKVMHKSGDQRDANNYRPICLLPILSKLFSKLLCQRMGATLDQGHPVDQAGFRKKFSCDDHSFSIGRLAEKHSEFQLPLWVAAIHFRKAFDCVEHSSLWAALAEQNVPRVYSELFKRLYEGQVGVVEAGERSREFPITRGTKRGDPTSHKLFNAVLQQAMGPLLSKWAREGGGVDFGGRRLTNLRFADHVLLVAESAAMLQNMLADLSDAAERVGLELRFGKTKVMCNSFGREIEIISHVKVGREKVEVLPKDGTAKYLGRELRLDAPDDAEIQNRINMAWRRFMGLKRELCNKDFRLQLRLRLFDSTVSQTLLYAAGTWTMNAEREAKLRTAQRQMLRSMPQRPRRQQETSSRRESQHEKEEEEEGEEDGAEEASSEEVAQEDAEESLEPWHEWCMRVTEAAEREMQKAGVEDWAIAAKRKIWTLAGHISRRDDDRWSEAMLSWQPEGGLRRVARPFKRWIEDIERLVQIEEPNSEPDGWRFLASYRGKWKGLEEKFCRR